MVSFNGFTSVVSFTECIQATISLFPYCAAGTMPKSVEADSSCAKVPIQGAGVVCRVLFSDQRRLLFECLHFVSRCRLPYQTLFLECLRRLDFRFGNGT